MTGNVLANDSNPNNEQVVALSGVRDANSPPKIVITEIMADPQAVADADGEWFEVYNIGAAPVDLNGWTVQVGGHSILVDSPNPLLVAPGGFFVFAANSVFIHSASSNYVTGPLGLSNTGTTIALFDPGGHEIDSVNYSQANGFPADIEGHSIYLRDAAADNSDGLLWETTQDPIQYGIFGNDGTPGAANPIFSGQAGIGDSPVVGQPAVFLSGALLTVNANGTFAFDTNHAYDFLAEGTSSIEQFTYTLSGGQTANVVLTIEGINDAPVAHDDVYAALEDVPLIAALPNALSVLANDRDVDQGTVLTATLVGSTSHGSLDFHADGTFIYTPDPEFFGTDSFTYLANDGFVDSNVATVTISVAATNDAPIANPDSFTTRRDTAISGNVLTNDTDIDGDTLAVSSIVNLAPADVVPHVVISEIMDNPNFVSDAVGEWFEVYNADAFPVDLVGWTIQIGSNTIFVDSPSPLVVAPGGFFVFAASADSFVNGGIPSVGYATGPLGLADSGTTIALFDSDHNAVDRVDYSQFDFPPDIEGSSIFLRDASADNNLGSSWDNSQPLTSSYGLFNNFGTPGAANPGFGGGGGTATPIGEQVTLASGALLTLNANGTFDYDPNGAFDFLAAGATAKDGFVYTASDGHGGIDTAVVTITVQGPTGGNHAPVAVNDFAQVTADGEVNGTGELGLLANDSDPDGDAFELVAINGNPGSVGGDYVELRSGAFLQSFSDGVYNYLPLADSFLHLAIGQSYVDRITYTIRDMTGLTSDGVLEVTVNGTIPAGAPHAVDDSASTNEDTSLFGTTSLLANDSDFEGQGVLTVAAVNGSEDAVGHPIALASGALLTVASDGTYFYDPHGRFDALQSGESATDSFDYTAANAAGVWSTATVVITINGVDDGPTAPPDAHAPVAVADFGAVFVDSEITALAPGLLVNDHDPDSGDAIQVTAVAGHGADGEFIPLPSGAMIQAFDDGAYDYVPDTDAFAQLAPGESYVDTITYTISDTTGLTSNGTLEVTVIRPEVTLETPTATLTSGSGETPQIAAVISAAGLTDAPGASAIIVAQLGYGAFGTNPKTSPGWTWIDASFSKELATGDEYAAPIPDNLAPGEYAYGYRFGLSTDGHAPVSWSYADLNGIDGFQLSQLGSLFVI